MFRLILFSIGISILYCQLCYAKWAEISNVKARQEQTELAGPCVVIEYDINDTDISPDQPVYVFIRYSKDSGTTPSTRLGTSWQLIHTESLRGNGFDIVEKPGHKEVIWWGTCETSFTPDRIGGQSVSARHVAKAMLPSDEPSLDGVEIRVRGIKMAKIPGGRFITKSIPGGGHDESKAEEVKSNPATASAFAGTSLALFYMAKYETTVSMYADYLNEIGGEGAGWNRRMADPNRCGIIRNQDYTYSVIPGRESYPVTYVSWYDAVGFLNWCGLRLPTEAEWEKALRGGLYLDGDQLKNKLNPLPDRSYPWGDESPNANGIHRCNYDGADDGFEYTAPVGSFDKFNSPYGICDLAGNLAEWTLDWYSTPYHVGLDGFRMVRGGSWMAVPAACDAITAATQLPLKESSIMGFRGVK